VSVCVTMLVGEPISWLGAYALLIASRDAMAASPQAKGSTTRIVRRWYREYGENLTVQRRHLCGVLEMASLWRTSVTKMRLYVLCVPGAREKEALEANSLVLRVQ
jgi:hypothetical protein